MSLALNVLIIELLNRDNIIYSNMTKITTISAFTHSSLEQL